MAKAAKRANGNYIEAGYKDKIVFRRKKSLKAGRTVVASWRRNRGLWARAPCVQSVTVREVVSGSEARIVTF
jgi:hypothetical protein